MAATATKQPPLVVDLETATPGATLPAVAAPQSVDIMQVITQLSSNPAVNVDTIDRLLQMHERMQARVAEQLFNAAMSAAQTEMRPVAADASNPQTRSRYASYAALDNALRPIYTKHGFGVSYDTGDSPKEDHARVLAYVTHSGGHARTYHIDMPADGKGAKGGDVMTKTHATGAAMSYGMRYLLKMIYNVAVGEDDRDGNAPRERTPVKAPAGYEDWLRDLSACADEGLDVLSRAFSGSKLEFRRHLTGPDKDRWKTLRARAEAVR